MFKGLIQRLIIIIFSIFVSDLSFSMEIEGEYHNQFTKKSCIRLHDTLKNLIIDAVDELIAEGNSNGVFINFPYISQSVPIRGHILCRYCMEYSAGCMRHEWYKHYVEIKMKEITGRRSKLCEIDFPNLKWIWVSSEIFD